MTLAMLRELLNTRHHPEDRAVHVLALLREGYLENVQYRERGDMAFRLELTEKAWAELERLEKAIGGCQ